MEIELTMLLLFLVMDNHELRMIKNEYIRIYTLSSMVVKPYLQAPRKLVSVQYVRKLRLSISGNLSVTVNYEKQLKRTFRWTMFTELNPCNLYV